MSVESERGRRKRIVGTVVGNKMSKTIVVEVARLLKHPKYGKYIRRSSIYKAHDENSTAKMGDTVEIIETRPISKTKNAKLVRVIDKASS